MKLFAKCIQATSPAGFIHAQHHAAGVYRRAGHVRRNGGHVAGITGHVRPEYSLKGRRRLFAIETMLRIHFMQQCFCISDPTLEDASHDIAIYCEPVRLDSAVTRLPNERTNLRSRHLIDGHVLCPLIWATIEATLAAKGLMLKIGGAVDDTLITAPSSSKSAPVVGLGMWPCARSSAGGLEKPDQLKASVPAKVEHPFWVIDRQFGFVMMRHRRLVKNTAQLKTLFALSTLWMVGKRLLQGGLNTTRSYKPTMLYGGIAHDRRNSRSR
jgi:IS5 family transposase